MPPEVLDAASYYLNPYSLPTAVAMAAIFLLGVGVLRRERFSLISQLFFLVTLTVSIWLFCFSWVYSSADETVALWWAKASYLGVPFIAPATYLVTVAFLGIYRPLRFVVWIAWALSVLFAAAAIAGDALVSGMQLYWWGYYTRFGWLGAPFIVFFGALLVGSTIHYWNHYRQEPPGRRKARIQWLMLAFGIGYTGIVDFVAVYGIPLYPFGYLSILAFVTLSARAIWSLRLVPITPAFAANEIVDTMTDALLVLDRAGVVRVANRAACELFGSEKDELVGKEVREAISGAGFGEQLQNVAGRPDIREHEVPYVTRAGEHRILSISTSVTQDETGEQVAAVCVARDITEQKQAEEEIRSLNESLERRVAERTAELEETNRELEIEIAERKRAEAERAALLVSEQEARARAEEEARAREVLLSIVSHDLRNPLSVIKANAKMLRPLIAQAGGERARSDSVLARIDAAAGKMAILIAELLDFGRIQAGQPLDLYPRITDLVELARQAAANHQQYAERHEIVVTGESELVGEWDPMRIERVLDNLISNAIKYSPHGGEVRVDVRRADDWAVVAVADHGLGIPESDLPYVFDWYHRAGNVSGRIHGTGVGLAGAMEVVKQHGGTMTVQSKEGEGSTFTIRLPLSPVRASAASQPSADVDVPTQFKETPASTPSAPSSHRKTG